MQKKRINDENIGLEVLERRRLLSSAVQPEALPDSTAAQVQPVVDLHPTYHLYAPTGSLTPFATSGPQGFSPSQVRTAYGLNQVTFGSTTGDGSGQTIAIIDAYNDPTIKSDLQAFDSAFGLPNPTFSVVSQSGSSSLPPVDPSGAGSNDWEGEEALDVEWAHAMAPGAKIILVEAADSSPSNLFTAISWARQQAGVSVVSMSFGGNETSNETQYDSTLSTPSGHIGVTFVASTGDSGAPSGFPALSPNVLATGGSSLAIDSQGNYQSETGWSGSGGGLSQVEAQPTYQKGIVTQSTRFRGNPDVAFDADPSTGVSIYDSYNNGNNTPWEVIGGTSVAAPAWAGIIAVADQGRVLANEGTMDSGATTLPLLYSAPAGDFHDITSGNNGFSAGSGYDLVTGRGSPKVNLLVSYLVSGQINPPPPPPPNTNPTIASITPNSTTVTEGSALTLTADGVSDPNATGLIVTFYEEDNGVAGLQTDPNTGDFAFAPVSDGSNAIVLDTTGATGTFTFYAQLTDSSGGASASGTDAPSVTVTINAPSNSGPSIGSITANPNPVVSGNTLTLTANDVIDPTTSVRRVYFYEETNSIAGLQTGPGGDFAFRPVSSSDGFSIDLDTTGVTGSATFYALAVDNFGNVSADGTNAPKVTVNVMSDVVPDAPTALSGRAVSPTEIDLGFSETDSGQSGFTIERALDAGFTNFTRLFTINRANVLSYSDTSLSPNTRYFYRVQAFNAAGSSGFSNTANAATLATPTHLVIAQQPTTAVAGHAGKPALIVDVEDAQGRVANGDSSTVTIAISSGPSGTTLRGSRSVTAVNGVATFSNWSLTRAGATTFILSAGNLTTAKSKPITITPDIYSPELIVAQQPGSTVVGATIKPSLIVNVRDPFGNLITTDRSKMSVSIASGPSGALLTGTTTATASGGVATFSKLALSKGGAYTLRIADGAYAPATTNSFNEIVVPTRLVIARQPSSAIAGHADGPIVVEIEDSAGRVDTANHSTVTVAIASGPKGTVMRGTRSVAAVNGVATFSNLSFTKAGAHTLSFTDGALSSARTTSFSVIPSSSSAHLVLAQHPASTTPGKTLSPSLILDVEDLFGNLLATNASNVVVSINSGPAGGLLTGTTSINASKGVATFSNLKLSEAGSYLLEAFDSALPNPVPLTFGQTIT